MEFQRVFLALAVCAFAVSCRSQDAMDKIAASHIEGNAPKSEVFDRYLKRDLKSYFCAQGKDCVIEYELLRDSPTQTGIAYPKYYVWVKYSKKNTTTSEGAVRVAAREQTEFDVTDFLSREEILASPSRVTTIFPAALADKIVKKARDK